MAQGILALATLLCVLSARWVAAQSTAPAAARCEPLTAGSVCDGVLDYSSVYVSGGVCQDEIDTQLQQIQAVFGVLTNAARDVVARYVCAKALPRCTTTSAGAVTATRPCASLCTAAATATNTFERGVVLGQLGVNLPNECETLPAAACDTGVNASHTPRTAYAQCQAYSGSVCRGVVDYPVFVPPHFTQQTLEAQLQAALPALYIAPPGKCLTAFLKYLCARAFLRCDNEVVRRSALGLALATPFPSFPCERVCRGFGRDCDVWLRSRPELWAQLAPQCNTTGTYRPASTVCGVPQGAGLGGRSLEPDYPASTIVWATAPVVLSSECNSWLDVNATATARAALIAASATSLAANSSEVMALEVDRSVSASVSCPLPLVVPDADAVANGFVNPIGGSCALPCPTPIYTRDELHALEAVAQPLLWLSCIFILFLAVSWTVLRERRKRYELVLLFLWCVTLTNLPLLADVFPLSWDPTAPTPQREDGLGRQLLVDRNVCRNNVQPLVVDDGLARSQYCLFTGSVRQFGSNAALFWFLFQGFDLFVRVCFPTVKLPAYTRFVYHAVVWSLSSALMIVGFVTDAYGTQNPSMFCGVSDEYIAWYIVYLPLGLAAFLSTVFVGAVSIQLFVSTYRARSRGVDAWKAHRQIMSLLILYLSTMLIPFFYRIAVYFQESAIAASVAGWVECLLTVPGGADACGARPPVRPDYSGMFAVTILASLTGIIPFAVYGTRLDLYRELAVLCCWRHRKNRCASAILRCVGGFEGTGAGMTRLATVPGGDARKAGAELYAVDKASLVSPKSSQNGPGGSGAHTHNRGDPLSPAAGTAVNRHTTPHFAFGTPARQPTSDDGGATPLNPLPRSPKSSEHRSGAPAVAGGGPTAALPTTASSPSGARTVSLREGGSAEVGVGVAPLPVRVPTIHNNFTL